MKAAGAAPETDRATCRRLALGLLARREHTPLELERKLAARGCPASAIAAALAALENEGLLDTSRFAEVFVRSRIGKGQGPLRIRAELRERGVPLAVSDRALEAHDWDALARHARAKKYGAAPATGFAARARQGRFLEYRGFTSEQIKRALADG